MKKTVFSLSVLMVLASSSMADGQTYEVNSGWNLLGATEDISDLAPFAEKGSMIWVYDDGEWKAIVPQEGGKIEQAQGFWFKSDLKADIVVDTQSESTDYLSYYDVDDNYDPEIDPADFTHVVDNPYLSFIPGTLWRYEGTNEDGELEEVEITVTSETKTVMGIEVIVVHDRVWEKGELVEDTWDWYAQDEEGNVWYFGEEVDNYDEGELKDHAGSWEAGVNGAKPGIVMLADPLVGMSYRQEYLAGEAEDLAKIESVTETVETSLGTYTNCVRTRDFNPFEPTILEDKYYCKENGGLAYEVKVAGEEGEIKLVSYTPTP